MHPPLPFLFVGLATASTLTAQAKPPAMAPAAPTIAAAIYSTRGDDKVHLVSLPDLQPLAVYDAGAGAHELAISADGKWALGSAYGGPGKGHQPADNRVFVLDLPAGKRAHMVDLGATKRPNDIAFLGSTSEAVVTTEVPAQLLRLDAATGKFTAFALEHRTNHMLALSPDAKTCFVSHVLPGGITRFDLGTGTTKAHGALPDGAEGIACPGDGKHVWVGCNRSSKLVVVDNATLKIVHEVERDGFPLRVKGSPDGKYVAVSCPKSGEVVIYEAGDVSKASTLAHVARSHGLGPDQVVTVGDAPNDIPMLEWATTSYAVANAHPRALAAATHVLPPNTDEGVADLLIAVADSRG